MAMAMTTTINTYQINSYFDAMYLIGWLDKDRIKTMEKTKRYLEGDHWQKGDGWGGPPIPSGMLGASETETQMERDLAPIPVLAEIAMRFTTGLVGREPSFQVSLARELKEDEEPTPDETADMAELNDALTKFWEERYGHAIIQNFATNLCSGRATLRFFIPPQLSEQDDGNLTTLSDALERFYLEAPPWQRCGVYLDPLSMRKFGIYLFDKVAINPLGQEVLIERAEITEIGQNGKTIFRVFEAGTELPSIEYDCNRNIWIFQAEDNSPLIGKPHQQLQRAIDFLNTILPKNAQYAGYRERHFMNVKKNVDPVTGAEVAPQLGPTTVNFWQAVSYADDNGVMRPAPATLNLGEPVDSKPIRDDIAHMNQMLLRSCHQEHILISGDATSSAVSRVQARAEFTDSLLAAKPKVEKCLRELFMTVLCLACELIGDSARLERLKTNYRIVVNINENAGPCTPEEQRIVVELFAAGIIPLEIAQIMVDVDDPAAAREMLLRERSETQEYLQNQATIMQTVTLAGASIKEAAVYAGVDPVQANAFSTDFPGGEPSGQPFSAAESADKKTESASTN